MSRNEKTKESCLRSIVDHGLAPLSDLNDYPAGGDIYDCLRRIRTRTFDADVDVQAETAEASYGAQLKCLFVWHDIPGIADTLGELYSGAVLAGMEQVAYERMQKYPVHSLQRGKKRCPERLKEVSLPGSGYFGQLSRTRKNRAVSALRHPASLLSGLIYHLIWEQRRQKDWGGGEIPPYSVSSTRTYAEYLINCRPESKKVTRQIKI